MIHGIFRATGRCLSGKAGRVCVSGVHQLQDIVYQHVFQKKMEGMAMVLMAQMAEFMKEDIILKNLGQTYNIEIQIDV